jgi:pimeloyl-ACP methyl ester carboxylesterase
MRSWTSGFAKADGADLYFERRGAGPPLLLIAGGGGDCGAYWPLANELDLGHDPFHRPCIAIAERLNAEFAEFPGGHLAPMEVPGPFAADLRALLRRLRP